MTVHSDCTKALSRSTTAGIVFTLIAGTLLHFVYDWSQKAFLVSFFSPVNESTWEHLKLLFVPVFLYSAVEGLILRPCYPDLFRYRAIGCLAGMLALVSFFYTYSGILGRTFFLFDLLAFFIGVIVTYYLSSFLALKKGQGTTSASKGGHDGSDSAVGARSHALKKVFPFGKTGYYEGLLIFLILYLFFAIVTWYPPAIGLFQTPS